MRSLPINSSDKRVPSKVLITGSAGFVGYHLAAALLARGDTVIGVDNLNAYYDVALKRRRNDILKKNKKYRFHKVDISAYKKIAAVVKKEKPDVIVHLAAQAGVRHSIEDPWTYVQTNELGTLNIFECARRMGLLRVLYASSSSVYGANEKKPFSEIDRVDSPISLYAVSKRQNELLAHAYHSLYGIESAGMRFFTVYGRYGRPDMALFKFTRSIMQSAPLDLFNGGKMARNFTHVSDVVQGILALLDTKKLGVELYNFGGGESISLESFVQLIEEGLGKKTAVNLLPMQKGDVRESSADVSKATRELGYVPRMSIQDGIADFTEWFLENEQWLMRLKEGV